LAATFQRQRLQKVLFPHGATYSSEGRFGTAETSVIFRLLQALPARNEREASPAIPSWNQLAEWLLELDLLRRGEAA